MRLRNMVQVIDGKRYKSETATLLASDCYWDGHNWERRGHNTFLLRTPRGRYFAQHQTQWEGRRDHIEPLSEAEAMTLWESLPEQDLDFEEAFPGKTVEDA